MTPPFDGAPILGPIVLAVQRVGPRTRQYALVRKDFAVPTPCTIGGTSRHKRWCRTDATYLATLTYERQRPRRTIVQLSRGFCTAHVRYWMAADHALHAKLMRAVAP